MITIKRSKKTHPDKFGWGDPNAQDCFLHPGSQKANPYHHGSGDERGGEFTTRDDTSILFEAAPDPNDKELTRRWETLTVEEKEEVSRDLVRDIIPDAMRELGTTGTLESQFGGYEGYTNPSFALTVDDEHAFDAAKLLGYALGQDSMAVLSDHPLAGLDKVGVVAVNLPQADMNLQALSDHYANLSQMVDSEGNMLVGGFTASGDTMKILNFTDVSDRKLAGMVDKQLGGKYNVWTDKVYSTLVEKKDYLNAGDQETGEQASAWRQSASRLRQIASQAINGELKRRGKAAVQKAVRFFVRRK